MFLFQHRGTAMALSGTVNWLTIAIISLFFLKGLELFGYWGMFTILTGFSFFSVIFNYFFVPETKGKTVVQVLDEWIKK